MFYLRSIAQMSTNLDKNASNTELHWMSSRSQPAKAFSLIVCEAEGQTGKDGNNSSRKSNTICWLWKKWDPVYICEVGSRLARGGDERIRYRTDYQVWLIMYWLADSHHPTQYQASKGFCEINPVSFHHMPRMRWNYVSPISAIAVPAKRASYSWVCCGNSANGAVCHAAWGRKDVVNIVVNQAARGTVRFCNGSGN